jgi:hypothetical protein
VIYSSGMPLDPAPLDRAGLHVALADLEALFQSAIETALPPYQAVDARQNLSSGELSFLRDAGVDLEEFAPLDPGVVAPELHTAALAAGLLATSLSVADVASRLGVDSSRIRQRLANHSLYGLRQGGTWRLPQFQFTDDGLEVVPGFGAIGPTLGGLFPLDVATWFTMPHVDLVDAEDRALSPRDWLLGGGDPAALLPLIEELRGVVD